jgi:hypothetical protein
MVMVRDKKCLILATRRRDVYLDGFKVGVYLHHLVASRSLPGTLVDVRHNLRS